MIPTTSTNRLWTPSWLKRQLNEGRSKYVILEKLATAEDVIVVSDDEVAGIPGRRTKSVETLYVPEPKPILSKPKPKPPAKRRGPVTAAPRRGRPPTRPCHHGLQVRLCEICVDSLDAHCPVIKEQCLWCLSHQLCPHAVYHDKCQCRSTYFCPHFKRKFACGICNVCPHGLGMSRSRSEESSDLECNRCFTYRHPRYGNN